MSSTPEAVSLRILQSGTWAAAQREEPALVVVADENTYREAWRTHVGDAARPPADFARESVVFVFAGEKSTGGHSVEVVSATAGADAATIVIEEKAPPAGSMVTQALTYPFAVVAVGKPRLERVTWASRDGRVVREEIRRK